MGRNRYAAFLSKLIQDTKDNKIEWNYLDENRKLCEGMNWAEKRTLLNAFTADPGILYFNDEDSFYVQIGNTYIVIFVQGDDPAVIYVIPNTLKKIIRLGAEEYGNLNTRLLNLVQSQFPNADAFIESFLNDTSTE